MAESERRTLAEELMKKEAELRHSKAEHEQLMSKLASIEKKLIIGGENMLEKAEKQAKLLDESNQYERRLQDEQRSMVSESLRKRANTKSSCGSDWLADKRSGSILRRSTTAYRRKHRQRRES